MRSGRRIQRRSAVNSAASATAQPTRAGSRFASAAATASASFSRSKGTYAASASVPRQPMHDGAEWECVAAISI